MKRQPPTSLQSLFARSGQQASMSAEDAKKEMTENARLRATGLLPVRLAGTIARLREAGVPFAKSNAHVHASKLPGASPSGYWAPGWAVMICEAEPVADAARDWAMAEALRNEDFKRAIDALVRLVDPAKRTLSMTIADFIMEAWTP